MRVNGTAITDRPAAGTRLLDVLRDQLRLTGTKEACGVGECGSCTVIVDGRPRLACITLAGQVTESDVETIEGVSEEAADLRRLLASCGGLQCGFCTPGQVVSAVAVLRQGVALDEPAIRHAMSGNLCRCTGYVGIVAAVARALEQRLGERRA